MYWVSVLGGGTGLSTVLQGLKHQSLWSDISAIVAVTDDGGGNGKHRDEFGLLPVSDFRKAILALADDEQSKVLRELFMYRFHKGEGLSGNTFGNLFLIALSDVLGSEDAAFDYAARLFHAKGRVLPIAHDHIRLVAKYEDGSVVKREELIDEPQHPGGLRITDLWIEPKSQVSAPARRTIEKADLIVLGPGDLYTSTLANIVVPGVAEAIQTSTGKLAFVTNLMSKYGQTHGMTQQQCVDELTHYVGRAPDYILHNTTELPADILAAYAKEQDFPMKDDLPDDQTVIRQDLLADMPVDRAPGDTLKRSLIRHDSDKLAATLASLMG